MSPFVSLFSILFAQALGAVSPGPSFLFVVRTAVAVSRRDGLAAAAGMGLGAALVTILALVGVRAVIAQVTWLYIAFKLLGGAYLVTLGWRVWRGASVPVRLEGDGGERPVRGLRHSFFMALATQLSNPKTLIVISGIYAALLPAHVPGWMYIVIPPVDFVIEGGWYAFVAVAMSSSRPRALYLRAQKAIDRTAACVLGGLGARLIFEGVSP